MRRIAIQAISNNNESLFPAWWEIPVEGRRASRQRPPKAARLPPPVFGKRQPGPEVDMRDGTPPAKKLLSTY